MYVCIYIHTHIYIYRPIYIYIYIYRGLPLITYAPSGVGGLKPPLHFHCVLHAKRGWVQITCKIAYVLNGRPRIYISHISVCVRVYVFT